MSERTALLSPGTRLAASSSGTDGCVDATSGLCSRVLLYPLFTSRVTKQEGGMIRATASRQAQAFFSESATESRARGAGVVPEMRMGVFPGDPSKKD